MILALLFLAAAGSAQAEAPTSEMCDVYYFGIGQPRDYARAFACETAEPVERRNWLLLAMMYLNGEGTARDLGRAREALGHRRPDYCGATCAALDEVLRRQEAAPAKRYPRVDYCRDIALTTPDANYCLGVEERKEELRRKRAGKNLAASLAPEARKRFAALARAFAKFKEADGMREYQNFRDGTIRGEASEIMEKRVAKHYQTALAVWGPRATQTPPSARPLAEADRELNEIYRGIMAGLNADIAQARATAEPKERAERTEDAAGVKTATRDAQRAWLRYAEAWKGFLKSVRPDDAPALE